jgi:ATP-dependent helicase/nuclease subunit B
MLSEEGRVMMLRALLQQRRDDLKVFHASARLPGFAQQLSLLLRELQRHHLDPTSLERLTRRLGPAHGLEDKLHDFALLLRAYLDGLRGHRLQDANVLLDLAAEALRNHAAQRGSAPLSFGALWLDGFAEMTPQELALLSALAPFCERAVLAFCLEGMPPRQASWLSPWTVVGRTFRNCHEALAGQPEVKVSVETLPREPDRGRFAGNPVLQELERRWAAPESQPPPPASHATQGRELTRSGAHLDTTTEVTSPSPPSAGGEGEAIATPRVVVSSCAPRSGQLEFCLDERPEDAAAGERPIPGAGVVGPLPAPSSVLRLALCANPEAEAILAAREVLAHVRDRGGRFRECAVMLRTLDGYHETLRRVFTRYEIPFFLDRRELVTHHPLAELTRFAVRTVAWGWKFEDWFGALKSGLVPADEEEIDLLENEALALGWEGRAWHEPLQVPKDDALGRRLEALRQRIFPPFERFAQALGGPRPEPTGRQLADAMRQLWRELDVEARLEGWTADAVLDATAGNPLSAIHRTVWEQVNTWRENLERAFPVEALPLRDWMPIIEAGLGGLTVGVIPPALDHVLIGTLDRSRQPELEVAILLGVNEGIFPAPPGPSALLTDADRSVLEANDVFLGPTTRERLGHERYFGYIACTRARRRLVLTCSAFDARERKLNPSSFIGHVQRLFPGVTLEEFTAATPWWDAQHPGELVPVLARREHEQGAAGLVTLPEAAANRLARLPRLAPVLARLEAMRDPPLDESLTPAVVERLYGRALMTAVTRLERFAECPFRFLVQAGLRARERLRFEPDVRHLGTFQHEALKLFHERARAEGKDWRDLEPAEARARMGELARQLALTYGHGVLQGSEQARFLARTRTAALKDFVGTLVGWARTQYQFNPAAAELTFGRDGALPPWRLPLGEGHELEFGGQIDRIDLAPGPDADSARCVVIDYKSSVKKINERLLHNGVQLQLPAYLSVLRHADEEAVRAVFGVDRLVPAGVFYVSLHGQYESGPHRDEVLADVEARAKAFRHAGRFDQSQLELFDAGAQGRAPNREGEQFNYRLTARGALHGGSSDPMPAGKFMKLLDQVEQHLQDTGRRIFRGEARVDPYRLGGRTPCDTCDYRAVCRIDPWTHQYRALREVPKGE